MGEIVDARPHRFLREMREHGNIDRACENSGMTPDEFNSLCLTNPKFDLAQVECSLEFAEDAVVAEAVKRLSVARAFALSVFYNRHPEMAKESKEGNNGSR